METTKQKVSLSEFRGMDQAERAELFKADPVRFRELMDEQRNEALAHLLGVEHLLRNPIDAAVSITLPIRLSASAELWVCDPQARYDVAMAAAALHLSRRAVYELVGRGLLKKVKLGGKLVFSASELRRYITENEVR
jgi:hypothetical protein